ncbi:hypothetical protein TK90_0455 [Thioalkalivibrio sp. K90mix]|nr:hypothetical protein TK90_0455 [Thioalkalivibrio sp. K90mix]
MSASHRFKRGTYLSPNVMRFAAPISILHPARIVERTLQDHHS